MGLFDGKVVAITGAGGGLGRAYAHAFAREGARLVVNDLGGSADGSGSGTMMADTVVQELVEMGTEAAASYDSVATREGAEGVVRTAVEAFGRLDVLINNAGILRDKTLLKMTDELWNLIIDVHLNGTYLCSQAAARQMVAQGGVGRIINTSSYAGLKGNFGQTNYGAAKAGIAGFTRVLALELQRKGITVNCIAPLAKTRLTDGIDAVPDEATPELISPIMLSRTASRQRSRASSPVPDSSSHRHSPALDASEINSRTAAGAYPRSMYRIVGSSFTCWKYVRLSQH